MQMADAGIHKERERSAGEWELTVRFYRWALQDVEREIEQGMPFLKDIQSVSSYCFLFYLQLHPEVDARQLLLARAKLSHKYARLHLNEPLSSAEETLLKDYLNDRMPLLLAEKHIFNRPQFGVKPTVADVRRSMLRVLEETTGVKAQRSNGAYYFTVVPMQNLFIRTTLRVFHYDGVKVEYYHSFVREPQETVGMIERFYKRVTDVHSWLGINPTLWQLPYVEDVAPAVTSFHAALQHFFHAMPAVIEGIQL